VLGARGFVKVKLSPLTSYVIAPSKFELVAIASLSALPLHVKVGVRDTPVALSGGDISEGGVIDIALVSVGESHPPAVTKIIRKVNRI
jgi:hypothetical protein